MKAIIDFIQAMFAMAGLFVLTCLIASFLFVAEWMNGVLQIFHQFGGDKLIQALPLNDPAVANWIMWGVALFASMAIIVLLIKIIHALQDSFWTVLACVAMFIVITFPVYNSVALGDYKDQVSQTLHQETTTIEIPDVKFEVEL